MVAAGARRGERRAADRQREGSGPCRRPSTQMSDHTLRTLTVATTEFVSVAITATPPGPPLIPRYTNAPSGVMAKLDGPPPGRSMGTVATTALVAVEITATVSWKSTVT